MTKRQINTNKVVINKFVIFICLFLLVLIITRIIYLGTSNKIDGKDIKQMAKNRNTIKQNISANRGTIFDSSGDILAQNISSYTVIAYLSPKRSEGTNKTLHVSDVDMTAEKLSPILNMTVEELKKLLTKNAYQVELGPGGRGITEIKKEEIENLNLPGLDFIASYKRYYPNGNFASYILGYAKTNENGNIEGEMGIESNFNDELSGKDGYIEYQKDSQGYKMANTPEIKNNPVNGNNIYLTIDSNIQLFVEQALIDMKNVDEFEWATITVADANTGKILASSSIPSFDPNLKNISSYLNPLVSYAYEPGSTMKTYTYMAALEKDTYDGTKTFLSGKYKVGEDTINDWNKGQGWGTLNYDQGYALSSNVGIANMLETFIDKNDLKEYLTKLGFGKKTGIKLPSESAGVINFKYPIEIANAGFGQGITTTPIQHIQALTSISNNGIMLKPYLIDKIEDSNTGKVLYKGKTKELGRVASTETVNKIKELMYNVTHNDPSMTAGSVYYMENYNLIGKTGTAQVVGEDGKYSDTIFIKSFAGMFPKDNPEIIIYAAVKGSQYLAPIASSVKDIVENTAKYLNISNTQEINQKAQYENYEMPNTINLSIENASKKFLSESINPIIIGNGNKVINQFPSYKTTINKYDKIFLVTNGTDIKLPDIINYSRKDVETLCNISKLKCSINGTGYVTSYTETNENNQIIYNIVLNENKNIIGR